MKNGTYIFLGNIFLVFKDDVSSLFIYSLVLENKYKHFFLYIYWSYIFLTLCYLPFLIYHRGNPLNRQIVFLLLLLLTVVFSLLNMYVDGQYIFVALCIISSFFHLLHNKSPKRFYIYIIITKFNSPRLVLNHLLLQPYLNILITFQISTIWILHHRIQ